MYLYVYDSFLNDKKYSSLLIKIEQRITDLGIKGRVAKLSILKNMKELISDAVKEGVETVVVVGDNQTFSRVINVIANLDVTLGIIPVDNNNNIAEVLGVPPKVLACEILASRIIKKIDLGKINNHYFINTAEIINRDVDIQFDNFNVQPTTIDSHIALCNFPNNQNISANISPVDGILETIITPIKKGVLGKKNIPGTILPFSKIKITSNEEDQIPIIVDKNIIIKTPVEVSVKQQKLKVIVGPDRLFN
jgi:diacylglycerol kinase family enzyme